MTHARTPDARTAGTPHLGETSDLFLTDGGLETSLIFLQGLDLPEFAAFPLLLSDDGLAELRRYFAPYLALARERRQGFVLDTPTWRASADWGAALGHDRARVVAANEAAVAFVADLADDVPDVTTVLNGVVGPRGDGYLVDSAMSVDQAAEFHSLQTEAFASCGADTVTAVTMTYPEEAVGVAIAARSAGLPVVVGLTVETDGRLPDGTPLGEAIEAVDHLTDGWPACFMVNCAHPDHITAGLVPGTDWLRRIGVVRANASRLSHAELDDAEVLDRGDVVELASDYRRLRDLLPGLRVVGGCCGTDHEHVAAIATELSVRAEQ